MRVVALGGCGEVGAFAARTALRYEFVEEVLIADRDGNAARKLADELGDRAGSVEVDVTDAQALASVLSNCDVVMNTVGPFFRFGVPVLQAAIEAKCDYIDINDDWEPTLEMLELDERARKADVTAVIGMGVSPGVTNLLAAKVVAEIDSVTEVITGWNLESMEDEEILEGEGGSAAIEHWIHQCTGTIRIHKDGTQVEVKPLQKINIEYPSLGRIETWTVGHPEAVTLPLTYGELKNSSNVMILPGSVLYALRTIARVVDRGWIEVDSGARVMVGLEKVVVPAMHYAKKLKRLARRSGNGAAAERAGKAATRRRPQLFAVAVGESEGKQVTVAAAVHSVPKGGMGAATGIPLATALKSLEAGKIQRHGVFAPESVIDPDAFFNDVQANFDWPDDAEDFVLMARG